MQNHLPQRNPNQGRKRLVQESSIRKKERKDGIRNGEHKVINSGYNMTLHL